MGNRIDKEMLRRMEKKAVHELLHYHEKSSKQKAKNLIKRAAGRYVPPEDLIFWPTGLLANALAENLDRWEDKETVLEALCTYFDRWIAKGMPVYYIDDVLCGVALIILYEKTGEEKYKTGADKMAEYLFRLEQNESDGQGSIPYRPAQKNGHVYVDGIGMMCPFLAMYGVKCGNEKALELSLIQIENMLEYGMDEKTGLPYHGFQYEKRIKYGIIGWGRAAGWLLMGMKGVLDCLKEKDLSKTCQVKYQKVETRFWRLLETASSYQRPDGGFPWQLAASEGPPDSSATAMIAWAAEPGEERFGKESSYGRLRQSAVDFLMQNEKDGGIYQCLGECMGFSQHPQVYGAYPWSLGTALAVMAQMREGKGKKG